MCQIPDGLQEGEQFDMICHHAVHQEVTSNPGPARLPYPGGGGGAGRIDMILFNEQRRKRRFGYSPASGAALPPRASPLDEVAQGAGGYKQPGPNAWAEFARSRRPLLQNMPSTDREALLGRMWKTLPQSERAKFAAEAGATEFGVEEHEEMDELDAEEAHTSLTLTLTLTLTLNPTLNPILTPTLTTTLTLTLTLT